MEIIKKKLNVIIAASLLILIGVALVTFVPKMSVWARSFSNETDHLEYIGAGQSVSISFYAPFDRLNSIKLDMERFGDRDVVTATDAQLILSDEDGNVVFSKQLSSLLEKEISFGGMILDRDVLYTLTYNLNSASGATDEVGVGVSSAGTLAFEMRGSYLGAPTKGTFLLSYVVVSLIVLIYLWFYDEKDIKKTGLIDKAILAVCLFMAITFVSQFYDLFMIGKNGLRMLDAIMDGQFIHYYDYVYAKELANGSAGMFFEYLYGVFSFLILAVIMIPIRFITDGNMDFSVAGNILVLYFQVVITVFFLLSVKFMERICKTCGMSEKYTSSVKYVYAFSSMVIGVLIAAGQIDVIYVIVMLWAMPFYLSGRYKTFSAVMAVALAIKILPFLVFLPLILLVKKNVKDIIINAAICLSMTAFSTLVFNRGTGYAAIMGYINEKYSFLETLFDNRIGVSISIFVFAYVLICIVCYFKNPDASNRQMMLYYSMLIIFAVYSVFTAFIDWHTQWLVPLVLSFAFIVPFVKEKGRVILIECVMEALVLLVSDLTYGMAYMVDNGMIALPEYKYQGISITEAMINVTPVAGELLKTLLVVVSLSLVGYFVVADPFKGGKTEVASGELAVDRSMAIGRIFVLYALMLISLWQYSYVG